jgi:DNA-binding winged helix-turn-helix (wHTH) protein/Tol biopolymer transport system component
MSDSIPRSVVYEFGVFRLEPQHRSLTHLDGRRVEIAAKAFDALLYLVEHAGTIVTRDELVKTLWPRTIVEDNSLNKLIATIRRALGEQHYIATLQGRGYQFVADVRVLRAAERLEPHADKDGDSTTFESGTQTVRSPSAAKVITRERLAWSLATAAAIFAAFLGIELRMGTGGLVSTAPKFRFTVSPPPGTVFVPTAYHQSVSPDGQRIAFIVGRQGERGRQLSVRSLDSADAEVLAGTEGAASLFWSPDSQFLGFFTARSGEAQTLKRVPARGGPVVTLSPNVGLVTGSYGTWRSDIILFAPDAAGGVSAVSPSGGDPKPVSRIDPSDEDTSHTLPSFLPDGDRFLYLAQPSNTIYLASLSSADATPLLTADSKAVYAPPGYLLYVRGGVLLGQPFDASRGRLTGEPVALAAPVGANPDTGGGRFSVSDNGVLAYRGGSVGSTGELVWFDRSGRALDPVDRLRFYQAIDLFDGDRLAMAVGDTDTAPTKVWSVDLSRGTRARLDQGDRPSRSPVWSPDGREVVFSSQQDDGRWALYRAAADGGDEPRVIHVSENAIDATDWSRNGIIAYVERDAQARADIWFLSATGDKAPTRFLETTFAEESAQFSPDGRWVSYVSNESGPFEVYAKQTSGSGRRFTISTEGGTLPRWREGEIVYFDYQSLVSVAVQADESGLHLGSPKPLLPVQFPTDIVGSGAGPTLRAHSYALSPDGKRILLMRISQQQGEVPIVILTDWRTALGQ